MKTLSTTSSHVINNSMKVLNGKSVEGAESREVFAIVLLNSEESIGSFPFSTSGSSSASSAAGSIDKGQGFELDIHIGYNGYSLSPQRGFDLIKELWFNPKTKCRVCADGASNRLYDYEIMKQRLDQSSDSKRICEKGKEQNHMDRESNHTVMVPDALCGDLDSAKPEVINHFESLGSKIIRIEDQNSTDLYKSLDFVLNNFWEEYQSKSKDKDEKLITVIYPAFGGRLDHTFQNISTALRFDYASLKLPFEQGKTIYHKYSKNKAEVILLSDASVGRYIPGEPSTTIIEPDFDLESRTCGIIPLMGADLYMRTKGLTWDLDETMKSNFAGDGIMSTSNHIEDDKVVFENISKIPFLFSTGISKAKPI